MFIVYQTTNKINGKKYIGVHCGNDPKYLGSGKLIKRAIKRYGKRNFTREVLFEFETKDEAYSKEAELVTQEIVESEDFYNVGVGGYGGGAEGQKRNDTSAYSAASKRKMEDPKVREHLSTCQKIAWQNSPERKEQIRALGLRNKGKVHKQTQETKEAIRKGNRKNSKVYKITNGIDSWEMNVYDFCDLIDGNIKSMKQCVWRNKRYKNYTFT